MRNGDECAVDFVGENPEVVRSASVSLAFLIYGGRDEIRRQDAGATKPKS